MGLFADLRVEKKYRKEIEKSSGLEKIRLLVRKGGPQFDVALGLSISYISATMLPYVDFVDSFYTLEQKRGYSLPDALYDELVNNFKKRKWVEACTYAIVMGVFLLKASNFSGKTIDKIALKQLIDNGNLETEYKTCIYSMVELTIDTLANRKDWNTIDLPIEDSAALSAFGKMASSMYGVKKDDSMQQPPMPMMTSLSCAIFAAHKANIDNDVLKDLISCGVLA